MKLLKINTYIILFYGVKKRVVKKLGMLIFFCFLYL